MAETIGADVQAKGNGGRWRPIAFRVAVVLFTGMFLVGLFPALKGIVFNWLPDEMFLRVRPDLGPADVDHRLHSTALAVLSWGMVTGIAVQLHSPERKIGAMLLALAVPPALALGEGLTGVFTVAGTGVPFALLLTVAFLHPHRRDLLRVGRPDGVMAGIALIGAVPWVVYAVAQAREGRLAPEWDVAHYGFVTSLGIVIVLWSLLGALGQRGWLWPATAAGLAAAVVVLKSLIFPDVLSGLTRGWAAAGLMWTVWYLVAAGLRRRRGKAIQPPPS